MRNVSVLPRGIALLLCLLASIPGFTSAHAQEMTPRAYWPAPDGTNVLVSAYQYSSGDVVTDPSLPIEGADSTVEFFSLGYVRTFGFLGRTANLQLNQPYAWGNAQGIVEGEFRSRDISTLSDTRARLSVNLVGAPTMDAAGFQALRADPRTIVGASLLVQAPTGGYDPDRLFNAGSNRWAAKPAIGVIWPVQRTLLLELEIGTWIFGDNDDFQGVTRSQDPILSLDFHLVKRIRPGFWASLDAVYYEGGRTEVDGVARSDRQENSRVGATLVFPFQRQHALRLAASTGLAVSAGGDFNTVTLTYLYAWQGR